MSSGPGTMIPIYGSVQEIPAGFGPSIAAIGNFDGVHLGHRQILTSTVAEARALGVRAVAITFDPHPEQFLRPSQAPKLLTPMPERARLLALTGIDAELVLPFNAALAGLSARDFVCHILVGTLGVRGLHEGGSFRFGHQAEAGIPELRQFGEEFGFAVHVHSPVRVHGLEVSSSAIRALVASGDLTRARWMLGRPFEVLSTPAKGRGIGTRLLVPTVNLAPYDGLLPAFGVYVTRLKVGGRRFQAVTNVGNRPTFGQASFAVESHILDFEPIELDEQTPIELEFFLRLRGEIEWPSPEALKTQIFKDVAKARRYFRLVGSWAESSLIEQKRRESCMHCGHPIGHHRLEGDRCRCKDCPCPGYEPIAEQVPLNSN
jgi:riboflavin kinase/FMN adenylyltransferase